MDSISSAVAEYGLPISYEIAFLSKTSFSKIFSLSIDIHSFLFVKGSFDQTLNPFEADSKASRESFWLPQAKEAIFCPFKGL